jgi:hypothetical protein
MSRSRGVRFAFDVTEGPNAGITSGSWEVKTHGESVYLFAPELMKDWKVALHADSLWMMEITKEAVDLGRREVLPIPGGRGPWKFTPTPIHGGGRLVFAIAVARSALLKRPRSPKGISLSAPDRWDALNVASVWMTDPGVEVSLDGLVGPAQSLGSGRQVWVTTAVETWGPEDDALNYRGSVIEAWRPETHGVRGPGLMIRGVTVSPDRGGVSGQGRTNAYGPANTTIDGIVFQPVDMRDLLDETGHVKSVLKN